MIYFGDEPKPCSDTFQTECYVDVSVDSETKFKGATITVLDGSDNVAIITSL